MYLISCTNSGFPPHCVIFAVQHTFYVDNYFILWISLTQQLVLTEGDAFFTTKLQDYTAVEKDEVTFDCELSRDVPVKWFKNEIEIKASKMVTMKVEGKRRILNLKKVENKDKGLYVCDCGTDKTSANLNIEGQ